MEGDSSSASTGVIGNGHGSSTGDGTGGYGGADEDSEASTNSLPPAAPTSRTKAAR